MATILVGMADLKIAKSPDVLTTLGLGSCVGVCLFDPKRQVAGMAHVMLPSSANIPGSRMKFADTGIDDLLALLRRAGCMQSDLVAKLAGGAHMFGTARSNDILNVGERNVEACQKILRGLGIPIKAQDVLGKYGRTIELDSVTGKLKVKTVGYGEKYI